MNGYKTDFNYSYKTKIKKSFGGLGSNFHLSVVHLINDHVQHMKNNFISKFVIHKCKTAFVFVYARPYTNDNEYDTNKEKVDNLDNLYRDLNQICRHTKLIGY